MITIPSHIRYPAMIFGLLGMTLVVNIILVVAVRSDGGAQIMEDYYEKSVHWDEQAAIRQESDKLGWTLTVDLPREAPGEVRVTNADGLPVTGLSATLRLRRPHLAEDVAQVDLTAVGGQPGVYRFEHPSAHAGLWDFVVEGEFGGRPVAFQQRQRVR